MERLFNLTDVFVCDCDYAVVKLRRRGVDAADAILVYCKSEDKVYMYSNYWDGNNYRDYLDPSLREYVDDTYCGGWMFGNDGSIEYLLRNDGFCDIEVLSAPLPFETSNREEQEKITPFILKGYEDSNMYKGLKRYHNSHSVTMNEPLSEYKARIGIELEVEFFKSSNRRQFCDIPTNWFFREEDGSLGNYGCEIITIPLLLKDAKSRKTWEPLCDKLIELGAQSWDTGRCGLHCHLSREFFGKDTEKQQENIVKMCYFYDHILHDELFNRKVYGRDRSYSEASGKTEIGNAVKVIGADVLKDKAISDRVMKASKDIHDSTGRYMDINTSNEKTIEFRKGRGSINANRIVAIIEYNILIAEFCCKSSVTDLTLDKFKSYLKNRISATSPLSLYFDEGDR